MVRAKAAQLEGKIFVRKSSIALVPTARSQTFENSSDAYDYIRASDQTATSLKPKDCPARALVCDTKGRGDRVRQIVADRALATLIAIHRGTTRRPEASVSPLPTVARSWCSSPRRTINPLTTEIRAPILAAWARFVQSLVDERKMRWIEERILVPTVFTLNRMDTKFKGVLYAGLMMTPQGPRVLEYNARFGDPECQPLLLRLKTDLYTVMQATIDENLATLEPLVWDKRPAVCVVMASKGYPGDYEKGFPISGIEEAEKTPDVKVFHAGTKLDANGVVRTNGGRVLNVVALGDTVADAKRKAYEAAEKISWEGAWYRTDVADKEINAKAQD